MGGGRRGTDLTHFMKFPISFVVIFLLLLAQLQHGIVWMIQIFSSNAENQQHRCNQLSCQLSCHRLAWLNKNYKTDKTLEWASISDDLMKIFAFLKCENLQNVFYDHDLMI